MVVKRTQASQTKAIIIDIEGTVTSISFVKETLFPYVKENLAEYVKRKWNESEFQEDLSLLREQCSHDGGMEGFVHIPSDGQDTTVQEAVVNNVLWQMNLDAKNVALKQLQGHIMREGYKQGQLKGHVFADVLPALQSWTQNGLKLYVYSSGSVEAQKLLFGHSEKGDLLELFSGHFDTEVGVKIESSSYAKIAKQLEYQPDEMVFFTDIPKEAAAAESVGMTAVLVVRDGNAALSDEDRQKYLVIDSLSDFEWEGSIKRLKISVDDEPLPADEKLLVDSQPVSATKTDDVTEDVEMPLVDNNIADKNDTQVEVNEVNPVLASLEKNITEEPAMKEVVDELPEAGVSSTVLAVAGVVASILKNDSDEKKETLPEELEAATEAKDIVDQQISVVEGGEAKTEEKENLPMSPTIKEQQVDMADKETVLDKPEMKETATELVVTEHKELESSAVEKQISEVEGEEEKSEEKEMSPMSPTIKEQQVDMADKETVLDKPEMKETATEPVLTEHMEPESRMDEKQIPVAEDVEENCEMKDVSPKISAIMEQQVDMADKEVLKESEMIMGTEPVVNGGLEPSVAEKMNTVKSGSEMKEVASGNGILETETQVVKSGQGSTEEEILPVEADLKDKAVESKVEEHLSPAVPSNIFAVKADNQSQVISEPKSGCKSDVVEPEKENLPEGPELTVDPIVMGVDKITDQVEIGQGDGIEK